MEMTKKNTPILLLLMIVMMMMMLLLLMMLCSVVMVSRIQTRRIDSGCLYRSNFSIPSTKPPSLKQYSPKSQRLRARPTEGIDFW